MSGDLSEFLDMMPSTVTRHPRASTTKAGDTIPGATKDYQCRIEAGAKIVMDSNGTQRRSIARIYLATIDEVDALDLWTLPVGYNPRLELPSIAIERQNDESGPHHVVVIL